MFSGENRFSMTCDSGHQLLWIERGTRYAQKSFCERDRYGPNVIVWAEIMHNSRTPLQALRHNGITERLFRIMCVRIYRGALGSDLLRMDENARSYRSV
ncbi:hypothetical protein TNCV_2641721 [Trichonephila clavipes]|nr:hypothetical protein TNCV_2641721 [Trichonephila clavipes]